MLTIYIEPLQRWQQQHTHHLPTHNHQQPQIRRMIGVMLVDESIGIGQGRPNNWFRMTAGMRSEHEASIVR
jgi:hypothetical protein